MKKGADKLTIRELFSAAGVKSLEEVSDALNAKGKTHRRHGLVLHVTIKYTNTHGTWFGSGYVSHQQSDVTDNLFVSYVTSAKNLIHTNY